MAGARGKNAGNDHPKKRHIERYEHSGKKRVNNPPVGLVTPETVHRSQHEPSGGLSAENTCDPSSTKRSAYPAQVPSLFAPRSIAPPSFESCQESLITRPFESRAHTRWHPHSYQVWVE
jgi:hypothetical protein